MIHELIEMFSTNLSFFNLRVDGETFLVSPGISGIVSTINPHLIGHMSMITPLLPVSLRKKVLTPAHHVVELLDQQASDIRYAAWKGFNVLKENMKYHSFAPRFIY